MPEEAASGRRRSRTARALSITEVDRSIRVAEKHDWGVAVEPTKEESRHWSEIDRPQVFSVPSPSSVFRPPAGGKSRGGSPKVRLLLIIGLGIVAIGVLVLFSLSHLGVFSRATGPSPELEARVNQITQQERDRSMVQARTALSERLDAWCALLESIGATGEDKTEELATFITGASDQTTEVAAAYETEWSHAAGSMGEGVVPGTLLVAKVAVNDTADMAGVLFTEEVQLADGTKARRLDNTTWTIAEGGWCLATWDVSYLCGGTGKVPVEQSTEPDMVVWSVVRVEENFPAEIAQAGTTAVGVTFEVENGGFDFTTPSGYRVCLWTRAGRSYQASPLTEKLHPATERLMETPLSSQGTVRFTIDFEIPAETDLADLEFEVSGSPVAASSGASSDTSSGPGWPAWVKPGTPYSWALAASALLCDYNGMRDDLLSGMATTSENMAKEKEALDQWWGIGDRDDLFAALGWIDQGGHRKAWDDEAAYLASLSPGQLQRLESDVASDPQRKNQIEMVLKYARTLGSKSLAGWDYSRYICLCRWGYLCGYLSEQEAWDLIMPVAAKLQGIFSSWRELGENYLIGRQYWSYEQTLVNGARLQEVYEELLSCSSSPWNQNPWDMDLGVGARGSF